MTLLERLHHREGPADGPIIVDGKIICSTCREPAYVYSPDPDSAELLHGDPAAEARSWSVSPKPEWLRRASFNRDLTRVR